MAKPNVILQPLAGVGELQFLLDIIRDKDALQQTLDIIEEARERANAAIEKVGPAQEIDAMHARARTAEQEADVRLNTAKLDASKIVADAKAEAERIVAVAEELESGVKAARAAAEKAEAAAEAARTRHEADSAGVVARERELDRLKDQASSMISQATAAKADFESRTTKLQETMKSLGAG